MFNRSNLRVLMVSALFLFAAWPILLRAHCDTLDGPVVVDAKLALEKGDVTPVLKWVKPELEAQIREAFKRTMDVRTKGPEAQALADQYFFETLVRIHREGEGAPYTGLKPAGQVPPGIALADKALEKGSMEELQKTLSEHMTAGLRERFAKTVEAKKHAGESVESGREFVEAYVVFIHYVEGLVEAIHGSGAHGEPSGDDSPIARSPKGAASCGHSK